MNRDEIRSAVAGLYTSIMPTATNHPATPASSPTLHLLANVLKAAKEDSPAALEHVPYPSAPMNYAALKDLVMQMETVYPLDGPSVG